MLAQRLLRHKEQLSRLDCRLREEHFARLNAGMSQSHETSAIHLDILTHLKRINSSVTHVAQAILDSNVSDEAKRYAPTIPAATRESTDDMREIRSAASALLSRNC